MPFTLAPEARPYSEDVIKRSRFTARLRHVDSEGAVERFLARTREADRAASHHCFAYIIGEDQDGQIQRSSDDGEPGGTAGAPMLVALRARDLVNVAAVVSRHYGGVKLGTGGLARAYSAAVNSALEGQLLRPRVRAQMFRLTVDHATAGWIEAELRGRGFEVMNVDYSATVVITVACLETARLHAALATMTSGDVELVDAGHIWR